MADIGYSFEEFKKLFFDRDKVLRGVEKKQAAVQSKFGAFVQRRSRTSIRKRANPLQASPAGTPPFSHGQHRLRGGILFGREPGTGRTLVGPVRIWRDRAPALILSEFGGDKFTAGKVIETKNKPGRGERGQFVSAGTTKKFFRGNMHYPARPFMKPALLAELPKFAPLFAERGLTAG
jgi:hypothetical protein